MKDEKISREESIAQKKLYIEIQRQNAKFRDEEHNFDDCDEVKDED